MAKFFNFFRGSGSHSPKAFRGRAIKLLKQRFATRKFEPGSSEFAVSTDEGELSVQNLYVIFQRDKLTEAEGDAMILEHFEKVLDTVGATSSESLPSWDVSREVIRPQFMPVEYLEQAPAPLAFEPMNDDICIGLVVDQPESYAYVRTEDLNTWGVSFSDAKQIAVTNLDEASRGVQMQSGNGPDRFIGIQAADGYDAVRILIPDLRAFLAGHLGAEFFAGVPNRDFLICWAQDCSPAFHEFTRQKLVKDNSIQPYPLTPQVLVVTTGSVKPEGAS